MRILFDLSPRVLCPSWCQCLFEDRASLSPLGSSLLFSGFPCHVPRNGGAPRKRGSPKSPPNMHSMTLEDLHIFARSMNPQACPHISPVNTTVELSLCGIQQKVTMSFFQASSSPHVYRAVVVQHLDQVKLLKNYAFVLVTV